MLINGGIINYDTSSFIDIIENVIIDINDINVNECV